MIIYALHYDHDHGNREDWNVFYTPLELFAIKAERDKRISAIRAYDPEKEFEERDITVGEVDALDWI